MSKELEEAFNIDDLIKNMDKLNNTQIKKIKMKESFYYELQRKLQEGLSLSSATNGKINNINGVRIEIDNNIQKDYEVEY